MTEEIVRVHQLASVLRKSVPETIAGLREAGLSVRSGNDRITRDQAAAALAAHEPAADPAIGRRLVVDAYASARESGREDWNVMTPAVLKNRLLDMTNRGFDETEYGAPNFAYFVSMFPDLLSSEVVASGNVRVSIDTSAVPVPPQKEPSVSRKVRERLRDDLWTAFVDFSSGQTYVWDTTLHEALPSTPSPHRILIPTLKPSEEAEWRNQFASESTTGLPEQEVVSLDAWRTLRLPSNDLPPRLRGRWNGYLRDRVMGRVEAFFERAQIELPEDVLSSTRSHERPARQHSDLRSLIHRCINLMTDDELARLAIPAATMLRAIEVNP